MKIRQKEDKAHIKTHLQIIDKMVN